MLSDYNRIKVKVNNRKKTEKSPGTWELNNILLFSLWYNTHNIKLTIATVLTVQFSGIK